MSEITTNPTTAVPCITACLDLKNGIETPLNIIDNLSSSNSDSAPQLLNISIGDTLFTTRLGSECMQNKSPQNFKENVFDAVSEQKTVVKIKPADSLEEGHSFIQNNVSNNNTPLPSLGGFTSNTEEQSFNSLDEKIKAVLQPIVYDNAKSCSYNHKQLNQTQSHHNQPLQENHHPFQQQASAPQQFIIYNQVLPPNAFQGLCPNGNRKYSNAFQLILNGFQPNTNNCQSFTNGSQSYLNAPAMHPGVAQFTTKGIQPSLNEKPTVVSQSCSINNHPLPNGFDQHPKDTLTQLNVSQSNSNSSELQPFENPASSSASPVQPNSDKPSLNGNRRISNDDPSQLSSTSMGMGFQRNGCPPFSKVGQTQSNGNKSSLNFNQLPHDPSENGKTTLTDVIAPLEKYFRGDTCLLCGFKSTAKWPCNARRHLVTHLDKRDFKCSICGKGFVTPEYQLEHEKTHDKEPTFQCRVCDSKFRTWGTLSRHEKTHEGTKFQCPMCDMQLATRVSLKRHLTIHTGELPYQCSTCFERFRTSHTLRLHISRHTGEKRFTCDICGKGFNGSGLYKQHLGTHEGGGAYECDKCDKKFNFRSNLAQHQKTHSEDKKHECLECGKKFKFPHHLRSHAATHGPKIKTE